MRSCVITKEKLPKNELLRIVRDPNGMVIVDTTGKINGRGAYIKKDKEVLDKAKKSGYEYVEEFKRPNKILKKINPDGLSIISIVTLKTYSGIDIVSSSLRLQFKDTIIQTILNNGTTTYPFLDKDDNVYTEINNNSLLNINIPKYEDMIKLSKKLACEMTEFKEIEWLFTLDDNKIELLGCGMWNNYIFAQKQIYLNNKNGLYSYYKTKRF